MQGRNKIKFGLKNAHIAKCVETLGEDGNYSYTYQKPVPVPGSVSITLDPQGEEVIFYADNIAYWKGEVNQGYEGDWALAAVPDAIALEYLGEKKDASGIVYEQASEEEKPMCALLFEFSGDVRQTRHVLYCCTLARPTVTGKTKEKTINPETETLKVSAIPRKDNMLVKGRTCEDTEKAVYDSWYESVQEPAITEE